MNLLIHHGALGDLVLTFPLLRALAKAGPTAVVAGASKARLAAAVIPEVHPLDGDSRLWSSLFQRDLDPADAARLREWLGKPGTILSFVSTGHDTWADHVRRLIGAGGHKIVFVEPRPPGDWPGHVAEWHRRQLCAQGFVPVDVQAPCVRNAQGPIVIHPGSGSREKCWPAQRFEELIGVLRDQGHTVTPLLGEVERDRWPVEQWDHWVESLAARPIGDLVELHAVLASARLFIGNDSGPAHLAAQMGLPTLALFGPTSPARWSPVGPAISVLAPPTPQAMSWLSVPKVLPSVQSPASRV